jgi:hypothetical protein
VTTHELVKQSLLTDFIALHDANLGEVLSNEVLTKRWVFPWKESRRKIGAPTASSQFMSTKKVNEISSSGGRLPMMVVADYDDAAFHFPTPSLLLLPSLPMPAYSKNGALFVCFYLILNFLRPPPFLALLCFFLSLFLSLQSVPLLLYPFSQPLHDIRAYFGEKVSGVF